MNVKKILDVGIVNTIKFNLFYFGIGGVIRPKVAVSRHVKLLNLDGSVTVNSDKIFSVKIGLPSVAVFDYKYERGIWSNSGEIIFEGKAHLGNGCRISNSGKLVFGDEFNCTGKTTIICNYSVIFGRNNLISWDVLIMDHDFHNIHNINTSEVMNKPSEIVFGDNIWCGCRSLILKGARITSNNVIASGSIINSSTVRENIVIGTLNKVIKENIYWSY